jgi:virginiamycin B lyase
MLYLFRKTTKKTFKTASPGKVFALIVLAIIIASLGYGWHRVVSAQSGDKLDLTPEVVTITQFPLPNPSPAAQPFGILKYTDHAMWFTEKATGKLGRIAQDGTLTEYALPNANSQPTALVIASDFHIWFTETNSNKIGRINPVNVVSTGAITPGDGGNFTEFVVPTPNSQPFAIAIGQGGMFFTEANANKLGLIKYPLNSSNPTFLEFDVPTSTTLGAIVGDFGGSDMSGFGRIWFTETSANKIGYFKEATGPPDFIVCEDKGSDYSPAKCFGEIPAPTAASGPFGIALGPDENIWFTEKDAGKIGRVDAAGVIAEFTPSTANTIPLGIVTGPDGTLWFTESNANNIGQITTTGTITERLIPTPSTQPQMIACDC